MNVSFFGRLTKDPEIKTTNNGGEYTNFSVATSTRIKENNGYKSLFVSVTAFGGAGKTIAQYFRKGSRIVVDGIIRDINVRESNGKNYLNTYVDLTDFSFVDTRDENQNQDYNRPPQNQSRSQQNQNRPPQYNTPPKGYNAPPPQYSEEYADGGGSDDVPW